MILSQLMIVYGCLRYSQSQSPYQDSSEVSAGYGSLWLGGSVLVITAVLWLYLARRWAWVRILLTAALPFALLLPQVAFGAAILIGGNTFEADQVGPMLLPAIALEGLFNPEILFMQVPYNSSAGNILGLTFEHCIGLTLAILPLQLAMLVVAAEFARDTVRRRKWGAA